MALGAGRLDKLVQVLGRGPFDPTSPTRGGYALLGSAWGSFKPGNAVRMLFGTFRVYLPSGTLTVRSETLTRGITAANQVVIDGQGFQVRAAPPPDRRTGDIVMDLVGVQDSAAYAREMDVNGDLAMIRRNGVPPTTFGPVRIWITTYMPEELTGNMQEGDRKALMLAADVVACGIPLPLLPKQDRLLFEGRPLTIQAVDDTTHRVGGTLLAYEIRISGN